MPEANELLRAARERLPSRSAPGEPASRAEVAHAVNAWLWETTGKRHDLDAHYLAKIERGQVHWPNAAYRAGLRHVLGVVDDAELDFYPPRRGNASPPPDPSARRPLTVASSSWDGRSVVERTIAVTDDDLMPPNRRTVLNVAITLTGMALMSRLEPFLRRATMLPTFRGTAFTPDDLESAESLVSDLRAWHSKKSTLARRAVVAQLNNHTELLKQAPQGTPETLRAFRVGAQLADVVASMAWDADEQRHAQQYFVLSAQLAHVAGEESLAAMALASLARQCYDLGRPDDGLDVVQLAQYYISRALQLRHPSRTRNRVFDLIGLARAHLITRDPDRACELITEALPLATKWKTGRVGNKLRDFHREATPYVTIPWVRDVRGAVADVTKV